MMRLGSANSISTFFRSRRDHLFSGVFAVDRATSRAPSWMLRAILRIREITRRTESICEPVKNCRATPSEQSSKRNPYAEKHATGLAMENTKSRNSGAICGRSTHAVLSSMASKKVMMMGPSTSETV